MSIAVNMNDPTNTGVKTTTGSGSMTEATLPICKAVS